MQHTAKAVKTFPADAVILYKKGSIWMRLHEGMLVTCQNPHVESMMDVHQAISDAGLTGAGIFYYKVEL